MGYTLVSGPLGTFKHYTDGTYISDLGTVVLAQSVVFPTGTQGSPVQMLSLPQGSQILEIRVDALTTAPIAGNGLSIGSKGSGSEYAAVAAPIPAGRTTVVPTIAQLTLWQNVQPVAAGTAGAVAPSTIQPVLFVSMSSSAATTAPVRVTVSYVQGVESGDSQS